MRLQVLEVVEDEEERATRREGRRHLRNGLRLSDERHLQRRRNDADEICARASDPEIAERDGATGVGLARVTLGVAEGEAGLACAAGAEERDQARACVEALGQRGERLVAAHERRRRRRERRGVLGGVGVARR